MFKKKLPLLILVGILVLYVLIRIKPLQFQTVGYTYDQGRDFIKVAEMMMNHKPTFIGPTTGINGLYHGAWWYYVLVIPFLLFKGSPLGFYYFNLLIQLGSLIILFFFARKYFGNLIATLLATLIALSPYFIFTSLFVGNNIMVLPVMLGFLIVNFKIFEEKKIGKPLLISLLAGLFLGLIGEFELSFGLFLIPTYFFALFIFKKLRIYYLKLSNFGFFLLGLGIAFTPRLLFELKNKFLQTKTFFSFLLKPKLLNPKPYADIFNDRVALFKGYYEGLFPHTFFTIFFGVLITVFLILLFKKKTKIYSHALLFFVYVLGMLFFLSTLYKDFFWGYYFDGIQYVMIFVIAIIFSMTITSRHWRQLGLKLLIILMLLYGIWHVISSWKSTPKYEGLAVHRAIVSYITTHEKNTQNFCVRIYTPPVIPYTYNYIFLYEKLKRNSAVPGSEWVNGSCWFIMEPDPFNFRLNDWKKINEPEKKANVTSKKIQDVLINHYEVIQ